MSKALETLSGADAAAFRNAILAVLPEIADHEIRIATLEGGGGGGAYTPSFNLSDSRNSGYAALIL